jgi:two-component system sensor histidine kinase TctE
MLMAPVVEGFIKAKPEFSAFSIVDSDGRAVRGDAWLAGLPPTNNEPEFHSEESGKA